MSGVGFMANIKTLTPSIRRRRRCEKHHLELYRDQQNVAPCWDAIPAPPITPPAAFLPPGFKRMSSNKGEIRKNFFLIFKVFQMKCLLLALTKSSRSAQRFLSKLQLAGWGYIVIMKKTLWVNAQYESQILFFI